MPAIRSLPIGPPPAPRHFRWCPVSQEPDRYPKTAELTRAATTAEATNAAAVRPSVPARRPCGALPLAVPLRAGDGVGHARRGSRERHDLIDELITTVDLAAASGDVVGRQVDEDLREVQFTSQFTASVGVGEGDLTVVGIWAGAVDDAGAGRMPGDGRDFDVGAGDHPLGHAGGGVVMPGADIHGEVSEGDQE